MTTASVTRQEEGQTPPPMGLPGRMLGAANRLLAPIGVALVRANGTGEGAAARLARFEAALARGWVRRNVGWCPICEGDVVFGAREAWLREHYVCESCGSIPRERALVRVLGEQCPEWRTLALHESSPAGVASAKVRRECPRYVASQWWPDREPGSVHDGVRCENLERLRLLDASVDVFVTQDVMEHVLDPAAAFREIARVLRPGGAHVFTTPIYGEEATQWRARRGPSGIEHLSPPEYHGSPIDPRGALVTVHWGQDIVAYIQAACGLPTSVYRFADPEMGLLGDFLDVLVTRRFA